MNGNNGYNVYKNNSINYASKEQLLLMLVDGGVKFAKIARQAIIDKDIKKSHENIVKAQNIYYELVYSLDTTGGEEWAKNMQAIYMFIIDRLVDANIKKDEKIIDEILPVMEDVKDTWHQAYNISKGHK